MLFSLLHVTQPQRRSTPSTRSQADAKKWTANGALLPLTMGLIVTFVVAQVWRLVGI